MIPLPWALLALLLIAAGAGVSGELHGRKAEREHIQAQQLRDEHVAKVATDAAATAAATAIAGIQVQHVTIRQPLEKQIVERPVFRDCVMQHDSLQLINAAITGAGAIPSGDSKLPAAPAPH